MRRVSKEDLLGWWCTHGVALCAEAQADGVPCPIVGRSCETCEHAYEAWLAAHPDYKSPQLTSRQESSPECGP